MLLRSRSSVATNGEETTTPPLKKKNKKSSLILPHTMISLLPDDLVLSCLARVSRLYYPTLSLVSKKFRSFIASHELYQVRSLLGQTESCLYVSLASAPNSDPRWFTLSRRPKMKKKIVEPKKKMKKKSSENLLVPIPSPQGEWGDVVALGSSIYMIGEIINNIPSSNVSILDCRSHTWHKAPNMQVTRRYLAANVIDGKIYVIGRGEDYHSSPWIEVFDSKTQTWNSLSRPVICSSENIHTTEIDGKICMYNVDGRGKGVAYNPKDGIFEPIEWDIFRAWLCYSHCVVDKVLFCYEPHGKVYKWFDTKVRLWRNLKGLERMPKIIKNASVRLLDYGGKFAVLWERHFTIRGSKEKMIWFAEISLERRRNDDEEVDEIWGRVEFVDCVLTVPKSYNLLKVMSATL